jgi:hypothetical protein
MDPQWQMQQEQMRRMQEQMRQQQEQMHRQQQVAAYIQQQKEAAANQSGLNDKFAQVEAEVARLRQERLAGRLSEEQFKAKLKELMVQDDQNAWWMIGADTGAWYRHNGKEWVQAVPPGRTSQGASATAYPLPQLKRRGHPFRAILYFILGCAVVAGLGFGSGYIFELFKPGGSYLELGTAILIWLVGFILVVRQTGKIWRGS